ncbi:MAG: MucR family transcriptional regulator [Alphaproteobacteria bacterium]|nr:MucR family transcriptional regulator [Alphaproteobacteria bacterium]MDB5720102.1 MucR family transcriptional regulator [Alphaproteobacteria bacterium]
MADAQALIELTADIVSAHVSNNVVSISDVPGLVRQVHIALAGLGEAPQSSEADQKKPVVSVRASIKPDYLVCLECGNKQKTLKRHLQTAHSMTPDQYREDYQLAKDYPMVAPNYSKLRGEMARAIGLGHKRPETASRSRAPAKRTRAKASRA